MSKPRPKTKGHTRSCANKQRFATEEEASRAAYRPKSIRQGTGYMGSYRCKKCRYWHFGHTRVS
jgi:hypothetical protein